MTRADNTHHLRDAVAARHDSANARARAALEHLDRTGQHITVAGLARTAGVSRSWLYRQPDLIDTITHLRDTTGATPTLPAAQRATPESLRQRLDALKDEAGRLRTENALLRDQLARRLGDQRAHP